MVVDCGGGTVDLTMRKLLKHNKLSEITERIGDYCGGSYVDREFLKFLSRKLGQSTINMLRENNYNQMQYMIQQFCQKLKFHFTGDPAGFEPFEFDIEDICPVLKQYCKDDIKEKMEENDWIIDINFEDLKSMFDPVIGKIIRLIRGQLSSSKNKCSAMFLVGGFSESKYLQMRVKEEFRKLVPPIIVPRQPSLHRDWKVGDPTGPNYQIKKEGNIDRIRIFDCFVTRGTRVEVDQEFSNNYKTS
ncbi:unnamed protein product [Rhizophagus irregularis]|nr:unnamed protein product [Rhizophagus irregularis]